MYSAKINLIVLLHIKDGRMDYNKLNTARSRWKTNKLDISLLVLGKDLHDNEKQA